MCAWLVLHQWCCSFDADGKEATRINTLFTINFGAINFGDNIFGGINFGEISTIHKISIENF